jgi:hypothetical protein
VKHMTHVQPGGSSSSRRAARLKLLLEFLEALLRGHGVQAGHHGALRLPVCAEARRVVHEGLHLTQQPRLEARLRHRAPQGMQNAHQRPVVTTS